MDITRAIQIAVVRADMLACRIMGLPWKRIAISLFAAWVIIYVVKAVRFEYERHDNGCPDRSDRIRACSGDSDYPYDYYQSQKDAGQHQGKQRSDQEAV